MFMCILVMLYALCLKVKKRKKKKQENFSIIKPSTSANLGFSKPGTAVPNSANGQDRNPDGGSLNRHVSFESVQMFPPIPGSLPSGGGEQLRDVKSTPNPSRVKYINTEELAKQQDKSHLEWQDDIARHVLTMYATTKIRGNSSQSQKTAGLSLLSFVDVKKKTGLVDVDDDIYMDGSNVCSPLKKNRKEPVKDVDLDKLISTDVSFGMDALNVDTDQSGTDNEKMEKALSATDTGMRRREEASPKLKRQSKSVSDITSRNNRIRDIIAKARSVGRGEEFSVTTPSNNRSPDKIDKDKSSPPSRQQHQQEETNDEDEFDILKYSEAAKSTADLDRTKKLKKKKPRKSGRNM